MHKFIKKTIGGHVVQLGMYVIKQKVSLMKLKTLMPLQKWRLCLNLFYCLCFSEPAHLPPSRALRLPVHNRNTEINVSNSEVAFSVSVFLKLFI